MGKELIEKLREAFEAWAISQGENVKTDGADYYFATTSQLYAGWKAGAAYQRAQLPQGADEVSAQVRFRRPEKGMPGWSVWQQTSIKPNMPAWSIDSAGYEVEYRLLYTTPQPSAGVVMPERKTVHIRHGYRAMGYAEGWNACLDEFARLNGKETV